MSDFKFLFKYILPSEKEVSSPIFLDYKHRLFPLTMDSINDVGNVIEIPNELREFYTTVGYGFFHSQENMAFNRLLNPYSLKIINLKEEYYEFDPHLEIYDMLYEGDKLLFFEIFEGNYLAIDKEDNDGRDAIYHFEKKIADSLEEFLVALDNNSNLLKESPIA